jgi:hypothetical protein
MVPLDLYFTVLEKNKFVNIGAGAAEVFIQFSEVCF